MPTQLINLSTQQNWYYILELFYAMIGALLMFSGYFLFKNKNNKTRIGGSIFWIILGSIFMFGSILKPQIIGIMIIILALLSAFKQVNMGQFEAIEESFRLEQAKKFKNTIFIPSIIVAVVAFLSAQYLPIILISPGNVTPIIGTASIGFSAVIGLISILLITKSPIKFSFIEGIKIIQQMGPTSILPQLLATLGKVFTIAGVGTLLQTMLSQIIPEGNHLIAIAVYCVSMALFTIIMGNAFAAFAVITLGIGVPFIIQQGGDPAVVGALGLTAGYCGTLMTPMAANFNIIPVSLLEMKKTYSVIKYQFPVALVMLVIHIILMEILAF